VSPAPTFTRHLLVDLVVPDLPRIQSSQCWLSIRSDKVDSRLVADIPAISALGEDTIPVLLEINDALQKIVAHGHTVIRTNIFMSLNIFQLRSLKTRVTLFTLAIFLISIWLLAFYVSRMLRDDMEHLLGEQQFSTVSFMAAQVDDELKDRINALKLIAGAIDARLLNDPAALQKFLEQRFVLHSNFNAGTFVTRSDGTAIADVPLTTERIGVNYLFRDHIAAALKEGKSTVSKPAIGKMLKSPVISMAAPIRDAQGKVIGALAGVVNLSKPNFLDKLAGNIYGKTGGYLLVAPQLRLVITATDKRRIMETLPAPGINPLIDRFIAGFEGSGVTVNPLGVEVLASAKGISVAGWYVAVALPTEEAFAPIRAMQQRMLLATLALTLLAGGLTWWMLRRQLSPMLVAARTLAALSNSRQPPSPLPITTQDEIGELIGGFNHLLKILAEREASRDEALGRLNKIAGRLPGVVFQFRLRADGSSCIPYASDVLREIYRISPDDVREDASPVFAVVHPDDLPQHLASIAESAKNLTTWNNEYRLKFADEPELWLLGNAIPQREVDGSILWHGVVTDVTGRKQAERNITELNRDFVSFLENTSDFIYFKDENSRFRFCSQTLANITGHATWRDMIGKHDLEVFPQDTAQIYYEEELPIFREGKPLLEKIDPYYDESGNTGWVSTNKWPLLDHEGKVVGLFGISRDITGLKKIEAKLLESESHLRTIIENEPECIKIVDAQGLLKQMNPAGLAMIEAESLEQVAEKPVLGVIAPEYRTAFAQMHKRVIAGERMQLQFEVLGLKGGRRWLETHAVPMQDHGEVVHLAVTRDITERKQTDAELRIAAAAFESHEGIVVTDAHNRVLRINPAFSEITGYSAEEIVGQNMNLLKSDRHDVKFFGAMWKNILRHGAWRGEIWNRVKSGEVHPHWLTISAVKNSNDVVTHYVGAYTDITERKQAEEKLHLAASVFIHAREGIMITRADGMIIDVNEAFTRITSYTRDEVLGHNPSILSSGRHDKAFFAALWRDLIEQGHWYGETWNRRKTGEVYAVMQTISAVRDAQGTTRQYVTLFSDITALKEHEKQLEHIAHYDALTNLPNRVLLADRLHQAMTQAQRRGQQLAVAYLDLDGFKAVNDKHGHDAGDQLLMTVATRMKQALREGDTLARLGGDEFVAVLLDLADIEASVPMLTRLLTAAAEPVQVSDFILHVSASLGVTFYPQAEDIDADQLLRQADQAMYQAKVAGKNRYYVFDAAQDSSIRGHHESLDRIRHALSAREFVLHYQPKVNMRTGAIIGAEALIRWQHPEKGLLPPLAFLPMIEDHPLAVEIGEWVLDTALTQVALWQEAGLDIPVSVNVGARQLQQAGFVARLSEILAAHPGVMPHRLELEVLETSALEDLVGASQVIEACREIGVMFALDDFGTGYSSLTYLKRLPVTTLKIDQSFVRDMLDDPDDLAILEGVLGLSVAFRRQVIAEGVETKEHGAMLLQLGCDQAQGFGIARPMPGHEIPGWSAAWRTDPSWEKLTSVSNDDLPLLFASVEHRAWIRAIASHLKGEREALPSLDHHQCRFGAWLDTEGVARYGTKPVFQAIERLHLQVHDLASDLCQLQVNGRNPEALARLPELHDLRDALLQHLIVLTVPPTENSG
jgi:diguanylate cyclase (GGDEF)-like protein/PAS domain S-box-containing protein